MTMQEPAGLRPARGKIIFDFSSPQQTELWFPVNDAVMGGVSTGRMSQYSEHSALFSGVVSLDHGGGFSSVRTRPAGHNLAGSTGLTLVVKGDGKKYKVNLTDAASGDGVLFQAALVTVPGQWTAAFIPFQDFAPSFRGRPVPDHPSLNIHAIRTFGLMISEKQAGPFSLEIASITADDRADPGQRS